MKTIGVLSGVGPQATMDVASRSHQISYIKQAISPVQSLPNTMACPMPSCRSPMRTICNHRSDFRLG